MKAIINAGTGEVTIRELTPDEQAERDAAQAAWEAGAVDRAKEIKRQEINEYRDAQQSGGVLHNGYMWDTDTKSRDLLTGAIAGFQAGVPMPVDFAWTTADNQDIPMDMTALVALGGAVLAHVNTHHAQARAKKTALELLTDETSVNNSIATW